MTAINTTAIVAADNATVTMEEVKVKRTHAQIRAAKAKVVNDVKMYIMNAGETVQLNNDLYELIGDATFNTANFFIKFVKDELIGDAQFNVRSKKKGGTFVSFNDVALVVPYVEKRKSEKGLVGRPCVSKTVRMGGLFGVDPYTMTGKQVEVEINDDMWKACKSIPKTFNDGKTVEVYRHDIEGQPSEYLQIEKGGRQYYFTVDAK